MAGSGRAVLRRRPHTAPKARRTSAWAPILCYRMFGGLPYHIDMRCLWVLVLACWIVCGQAGRKGAPPKKQAAPAAVPAAPASKWRVQKLAVEGNRAYTDEQVLAVAGLKAGQLAGKPEFEAARDRLIASGAFESVGYKFEPGPDKLGYITFQVTETPSIFPVQFEDLG